MGCTFEKNGYTDFKKLTQDLVTVLLDNGFVKKFPSAAITNTDTKFTLETDAGVDPLSGSAETKVANRQPWRIHFDCSDTVTLVDPGTLRVYIGTHIQLPDSGDIATAYYGTVSITTSDAEKVGKYPRKSGELTRGYYTFDAKSAGKLLSDNEMPIPFASKNWGAERIMERMTVAGVDGTDADPNDSNISMLGADLRAVPLSFRATTSDHGLALVIWEEGEDLWGNKFSWFVVQRPVDPDSGKPLTNKASPHMLSRCPVFCVYSIGGGQPANTSNVLYRETPLFAGNVFRSRPEMALDPVTKAEYIDPITGKSTIDDYFDAAQIYQFTVREVDVLRPSVPVLATVDTPDHKAIINGKQQVSITEGNQYVISFINDINSDRYLYKEELDMITYASADVISMWSDVTLTPYKVGGTGAAISVKYKAMHANMSNNTGMRILIMTLSTEQGVSGDCSTVV